MENSFKRIEKYFLPDEAGTAEKLRLRDGYVDTHNQPYDRLRRSLKRLFPGYPDVFDYSKGSESDDR